MADNELERELERGYELLRKRIFAFSSESTIEEFKSALPLIPDIVDNRKLHVVYDPLKPYYQIIRYFINLMIDKLGINEVSNQIHDLDASLGCKEYLNYFVRQRLEHE